jgi:membrane-bound lytic murein transglycosylase D
MAPDSRFWRLQLGEATTKLWRAALYVTLPFFLCFVLLTALSEANTEHLQGDPEVLPTGSEPMLIASVSPPHVTPPASPAGEWSDGIDIHVPNQPAVMRYVEDYKGQDRDTFMEAYERSRPLVPAMTDILESYGVPPEMVYLALVESKFEGKAISRGAGGYWQLMPQTARMLGLRVDRWVDERFDPVKSTEAAAQYLNILYERYQSWPMAMAAYNAGDGNVSRAVRKHKTCDFWKLSGKKALPPITRHYVPKVLAAIRTARDLESCEIPKDSSAQVFDCESIRVNAPLDLHQVAKWLNVPVGEIRDLNPSLLHDRVPPNSGYDLRLPSGARDRFDLAYENYLRQ